MEERGLMACSMLVREPRVAILLKDEVPRVTSALIETVEVKDAQSPFLHNQEDETLYVLESSLNVWVAGNWLDVSAGTAVFLPHGVEHALIVATETARMLIFIVSAGFEGFCRGIGATGTSPLNVERLVTTVASYDCEITGPPPEIIR